MFTFDDTGHFVLLWRRASHSAIEILCVARNFLICIFENPLTAVDRCGAPCRSTWPASMAVTISSQQLLLTVVHSEKPGTNVDNVQDQVPLFLNFHKHKDSRILWLKLWHTCDRETFLENICSSDLARTRHESIVALHKLSKLSLSLPP